MALRPHYSWQDLNITLGDRRQCKLGSRTYAARPCNEPGYEGQIDLNLDSTTFAVLYPDGLVHLNSDGQRSTALADRIQRVLPPGWTLESEEAPWTLAFHSQHCTKVSFRTPFRDGITVR